MVQFSTIVFCVQELSSIAKRNKQEGFLMMCPNRKKEYYGISAIAFSNFCSIDTQSRRMRQCGSCELLSSDHSRLS